VEKGQESTRNDEQRSNCCYQKGGILQIEWLSNRAKACDFTTGQWSILPECPHYDFSLVVVNNFLTVVCGELLGEPTNVLLSLVGEGKDRKWLKICPPMPTKRFRTTAVCSETSLVVVGGTMSI